MRFHSLLLVDVGNTKTKWAESEIPDDQISEASTQGTSITVRGEELTATLTSERIRLLRKEFPGYFLVLTSVVPGLVPHFSLAFKRGFHVVTAESPFLGLLFDYPKPSEVGSDRLVAASAVREDGVRPTIIVQCGTATAFSVIDGDGRFCGGVIAPGPHAQLAALVDATAQLPLVELDMTGETIGKSTEQAIRLGIMLSYCGGVNEILRQLCKENKPPLISIILTGGNAHFLTDYMEFPFTLRPLLVFEGLRIIGLRAFKDV